MSDGKIEQAERDMLRQLSEAFGVSAEAFAPFFNAIEFKNNKSILGPYDPDGLDAVIVQPHLAMAAAIIYMMSADGKIAKEEIGQLKLMIGEFEGLLTSAMKYVRNVKMTQFLRESAPYLNDQQKLLILTVVFDAMQSDGKVETDEHDLFKTIQKAFGIKDDAFNSLASVMTTKNIKHFALDVVDPKAIHKRRAKRKPQSTEGLFSLHKSVKNKNPNDQRHLQGSPSGTWQREKSTDSVENIIQQTFERNIQDVQTCVKGQADVNLISDNAKLKEQALNLSPGAVTDHIQNLPSHGLKANIQSLSTEAFRSNRQEIPTDAGRDTVLGVDVKALKSNSLGLPVIRYNEIMAGIDHDSRMESLQAEIKYLHEKLDQVKPPQQFLHLGTFRLRTSQTQDAQGIEDALVENTQMLAASPNLDSRVMASNHKSKLGDILHQRLGAVPPLEPLEPHADSTSSQVATDSPSAPGPATDLAKERANEDGQRQNLEHPVQAPLDGGIRLRSLLLLCAVSFPLVVFAYGWIYPTMACQGQAHLVQSWLPDGELSEARVIEEDRLAQRHKLQIRRDEVHLNNQRFPLFKELNPGNHFARTTQEGLSGSYSNHLVDQMDYAFSYNKQQRELSIISNTDGIRYLDGQSGRVNVSMNFKGQCEAHWF